MHLGAEHDPALEVMGDLLQGHRLVVEAHGGELALERGVGRGYATQHHDMAGFDKHLARTARDSESVEIPVLPVGQAVHRQVPPFWRTFAVRRKHHRGRGFLAIRRLPTEDHVVRKRVLGAEPHFECHLSRVEDILFRREVAYQEIVAIEPGGRHPVHLDRVRIFRLTFPQGYLEAEITEAPAHSGGTLAAAGVTTVIPIQRGFRLITPCEHELRMQVDGQTSRHRQLTDGLLGDK